MYWKRGTIIGSDRYEIIDELGHGGFGLTYKARHRELGSFCVIKAIGTWLRRDPNYDRYVRKFRNEGRRLAELAQEKPHPHIVRVFDLFREPDNERGFEIDCLVMDFIPGDTLYMETNQWGKLPEAEAVRYVQQVGNALIEVHKRDLIHWDVTPMNIMIRPEKEAVLIDFGIAGDCPPSTFSRQFGNLAFAPYEQLMEGIREKTCDIYTLGASLYYAVTQQEPTLSNARKLRNKPLIAPKEYASMSSQVNDAILWAMAIEPEERPQSMEEWLQCFAPREEDDLSIECLIPPQEDDLSSEKGVNYQRLRDLLKAQKWLKADMETYHRMLEVAGREKGGWLDKEDLENFARTDLRTIDQLWVKYSNGHFGLSVQKRIWLDLGGRLGDYDWTAYEQLARRVGWLKGVWLNYPNDFTFNINAPRGHLPARALRVSRGWVDWVWAGSGGGWFAFLFPRL